MQATRSLTNWLPAHGDCSHTSLLWTDRALRPRFIRSSGPWLKLWSIESWFWLKYQVLSDRFDWNSERLMWLKHGTIELKNYWKMGLNLSIEWSVRLTICLAEVLNDSFDSNTKILIWLNYWTIDLTELLNDWLDRSTNRLVWLKY